MGVVKLKIPGDRVNHVIGTFEGIGELIEEGLSQRAELLPKSHEAALCGLEIEIPLDGVNDNEGGKRHQINLVGFAEIEIEHESILSVKLLGHRAQSVSVVCNEDEIAAIHTWRLTQSLDQIRKVALAAVCTIENAAATLLVCTKSFLPENITVGRNKHKRILHRIFTDCFHYERCAVTPEFFYSSIKPPDTVGVTDQVDGLRITLLPFQRRTLRWMMDRETRLLRLLNPLEQEIQSPGLPLPWIEASDGEKRSIYLNPVNGIVSIRAPRRVPRSIWWDIGRGDGFGQDSRNFESYHLQQAC